MENKSEDRNHEPKAIKSTVEGCLDPEGREKRAEAVHGTVDFLMRRMHHKGELPAFSSHMIEINSKLSSLTSVNFSSAGDLAGIILKDFSLTNRLLKIVNSALYAGQSGKVTTISKALFLLGIEKIRIMAATLMIFDHLENKSQAKELQEIALNSLMSGLVASSIAEKMKLGGTEEVFICAMLYNLGKMLVICYFPEEYEEIKRRMSETGQDETAASKSVLGISYNDLGMAVSRSWNFPDKIVNSMEPLSEQLLDQPKTELGNLRVLSSYSNELLSSLINSPSPERAEVLSSMLKRYRKRVPIPQDEMKSLLESTVTKVHPYSDAVKADKQSVNRFKNLFQSTPESIPEVRKTKTAEPSENPVLPKEPVPHAAPSGATDAESKRNVLANGLREIKEVMKGAYRLNDVLYMILETMYRGFELSRVVFCLRDAKQGAMVARFGLGENIDEIVRHFHFRISRSSDLFNIVIAQGKGILIDNAANPNILKILPDWYQYLIAAPSFFIYPLISPKGCIGMFYGDRKMRETMLTEADKKFMEELRDIFLFAITRQQ
ncbi:HDOD domain-containing protein [Syntrophus gentianae]|uniref:HDOD domain-containing protein n=1 Tax=Syntrophus gentianae TaxID=43775 RepID=A0A1H7ZCC9_9BACT|nr:HDOD domain-containing protein [Syntrophus gentianae]SEM55208.1 HDOD domain-containing protein [Syntrophus gentianae]